jgi:hypothetical protein
MDSSPSSHLGAKAADTPASEVASTVPVPPQSSEQVLKSEGQKARNASSVNPTSLAHVPKQDQHSGDGPDNASFKPASPRRGTSTDGSSFPVSSQIPTLKSIDENDANDATSLIRVTTTPARPTHFTAGKGSTSNRRSSVDSPRFNFFRRSSERKGKATESGGDTLDEVDKAKKEAQRQFEKEMKDMMEASKNSYALEEKRTRTRDDQKVKRAEELSELDALYAAARDPMIPELARPRDNDRVLYEPKDANELWKAVHRSYTDEIKKSLEEQSTVMSTGTIRWTTRAFVVRFCNNV